MGRAYFALMALSRGLAIAQNIAPWRRIRGSGGASGIRTERLFNNAASP